MRSGRSRLAHAAQALGGAATASLLPRCDEGRSRHGGGVARSDERRPRGSERLAADDERRARCDGVSPRGEGRLPPGGEGAPRSCRTGGGRGERGATPGLRGPRKRERRRRSEQIHAGRLGVIPWRTGRGGRRGERLSRSCWSLPWCDERRPRNDGSRARFDQPGARRGRGTSPRAEWRRIETDCAAAASNSVAVHAALSATAGAGGARCDERVAKNRERLSEHFEGRALPSRGRPRKNEFRPRRKARGARGFRAGPPRFRAGAPRRGRGAADAEVRSPCSSGGAPRDEGGSARSSGGARQTESRSRAASHRADRRKCAAQPRGVCQLETGWAVSPIRLPSSPAGRYHLGMIRPRLAGCPSCSRHVRVDEPTCPFCSVALEACFRATAAPRQVAARLSRAALYALGASSLTVVACGTSSPPYGQPPTIDSGATSMDSGLRDGGARDDGSQPDVMGGALYGGPPQDSGAVDAIVGPPQDGGREGGAGPVYGAPPQDL